MSKARERLNEFDEHMKYPDVCTMCCRRYAEMLEEAIDAIEFAVDQLRAAHPEKRSSLGRWSNARRKLEDFLGQRI